MAKKKGLYIMAQDVRTLEEWERDNPVIPDKVMIFVEGANIAKLGKDGKRFSELENAFESGKAPRFNEETGNWERYDEKTWMWVDTGIGVRPGRAPRINPDTKNWENWDDELREYVDTGIYALTPGAPRITDKNTWEIWDPDTRQYKDSGLGVVLATNIDGGKPSSVYTPDQVINFGKVKR